jgi:hypothetical protein
MEITVFGNESTVIMLVGRAIDDDRRAMAKRDRVQTREPRFGRRARKA